MLLFTGNMSYAPNVDAAQHLVKDILPRIQHPNVRVVLAGANPKPSIKALADDRVTVTGWVDDIAQEYREPRCSLRLSASALAFRTKFWKPWPLNFRACCRPMPSPHSICRVQVTLPCATMQQTLRPQLTNCFLPRTKRNPWPVQPEKPSRRRLRGTPTGRP